MDGRCPNGHPLRLFLDESVTKTFELSDDGSRWVLLDEYTDDSEVRICCCGCAPVWIPDPGERQELLEKEGWK
jgi:hypothetical protein